MMIDVARIAEQCYKPSSQTTLVYICDEMSPTKHGLTSCCGLIDNQASPDMHSGYNQYTMINRQTKYHDGNINGYL